MEGNASSSLTSEVVNAVGFGGFRFGEVFDVLELEYDHECLCIEVFGVGRRRPWVSW